VRILKEARLVFNPLKSREGVVLEGKGGRFPTSYGIDGEGGIYRHYSRGGGEFYLIPRALFTASPVSSLFKEEEIEALSNEEGNFVAVLVKDDRPIAAGVLKEPKIEVVREKPKYLEDLKAYETPLVAKSTLLTTGLILGSKTLLGRLERAFRSKLQGKKSVDDALKALKLSREAFLSLEKLYQLLRESPPQELKQTFTYLKNQGVKPASLARLFKELSANSSYNFLPTAVVVDYQAGSGDHLKVFREIGYPAVLTGIEVREKPENALPNNEVAYGVDFLYAYPTLEKGKNEYLSLSKAIYFLNPPYTGDRLMEKLTVSAVPEGAPVVGVFPTALASYLKKNLRGWIFTVPAEEVGYDPKITPEFLLVVGKKDSRAPQVIEKEVSSLEEVSAEVFSTTSPIFEEVKNSFNAALASGTQVKNNVVAFFNKKARLAAEKTRKFLEEKAEEGLSVSRFLYTENLKRGRKILPDFRFAGDKPLMSLKEAVGNVPYLSYLKEAYPEVYREVVRTAKEAGLEVPEVGTKGIEYTTTENLGLVKLRYYPKVIEASGEVWEVLLELVRNEALKREAEGKKGYADQISLLEELKKSGRVKKFVVKATAGKKVFGGEVNVGATPVLTADDAVGREIALINLNLSEFYEELEKRGVVNPREKYRVADPDAGFKSRFLLSFYRTLKNTSRLYGLTDGKLRALFPVYLEFLKGREVVSFRGKEYDFSSFLLEVAGKESRILEEFTKRFLSTISPEREVSKRLGILFKSRGVDLSLAEEVRKIVREYRKSPYRFFVDEKEKAEELIRKVLSEKIPGERKGLLEDAVMAVWDGLAVHYSAFDQVAEGSATLVRVLFEKELIAAALAKKDPDRAFGIFTRIMEQTCGIKRHQLNEAIRLLYKVHRTGEKGHLLGWEMRSGKTLAMVLAGWFYGVMTGRDAYLMPRSANVNDVITQILARAPFAAPNLVGYEVSTVEVRLPDDARRSVVAPKEYLFPNLFGILSNSRKRAAKNFIVGGGEKIGELLSTYALTMEDYLKIAERKLADGSLEELLEDERFRFVADMDAYPERARLALYWYLKKLEKEGLLNLNALSGVKEVLLAHSERLKGALEEDARKPQPAGFAFKIVPKSRLSQFSFGVSVPYQPLPVKDRRASWSVMNAVSIGNGKEFPTLIRAIKEALVSDPVVLRQSALDELEEVRKRLKVREVEIGKVGEEPIYRIEVEGEELEVLEFEERFKNFRLSGLLEDLFISSKMKGGGRFATAPVSLEVELKGVFYFTEKEDKTAVPTFAPFVVERINEDRPEETVWEKVSVPFTLNFTVAGMQAEGRKVEGLPPVRRGNESGGVSYFVSSEFEEGNSPAVIVDEVDEVSNTASSTYRALFSFARKSGLRIGATGTPTSGYPETVMSLMGLISELPLESVERSINAIVNNYSVYAVKEGEKNKLPFVYLTALLEASEDERNYLIDLLKRSDTEQEFSYGLEDYLKSKGSLYLLGILQRYSSTMPERDRAQHFSYFKEAVARAEKKSSLLLKPSTVEKFFTTVVKGYVKRVPGTFDPIGFVSSLSGASLSLNTRENLKKEFLGREVEEKIEFDADGMTKALSLKGSAPEEEYFAEGTYEIRKLVDGRLSEYAKEKELAGVYEALFTLAKGIYEEVLKNPEKLLKTHGINLNPKEAKIYAARSRKSVPDGLYDLFALYANLNFDGQVLEDLSQEKRELFLAYAKEVIDAYAKAVNLDREKKIKTLSGYGVRAIPAPTTVQPSGELSLNCIFSERIDYESPRWEELKKGGVLREDFVLPFRYHLLSDSSLEVIDAITNAGYSEKNAELASSKSYLLTSSRVIPLTAYLLDAVAEAYRSRKEGTNPFVSTQILVRISDDRMKRAIEALNRKKLEKAGIFIRTFTDNAALDAESQKWKRYNRRSEEKAQLIVVSTDEAIARGVDLSHLDEILYAGVSRSGKTASQLFARLFSVERHEGKVNVFGLFPFPLETGSEVRW